jgi:hypothetical protein
LVSSAGASLLDPRRGFDLYVPARLTKLGEDFLVASYALVVAKTLELLFSESLRVHLINSDSREKRANLVFGQFECGVVGHYLSFRVVDI